MKFSTRILYGLKAVLVLASRYGEGSVAVSQIAKKERISSAYLEQILNALKKKGFVKSVRGPQGGYALAKKPSEIRLDALFYILANKNIFDMGESVKFTSDTDEITIANLIFWRKFKSSLESSLASMSLKNLIDEARELKKSKSHAQYPFSI